MYDTAFTPLSRLEELVSWNIDKQISTLQEALQNIIDNAIQHTQSISNEDINRVGIAYNLLVSYITNFVRSHPLNQRDRGVLDGKFLELEPLINQLRQILNNPQAYNVEVSAANTRVLDHIEQQVRDSNYTGLSLVNYRRLPISTNSLNPVQANVPRTPRRLPRPPARPGDDDEDYGDDSMPYPRARNQSVLRTSDLVTGLNSRAGTPHSEGSRSSAYQTPGPSFQPPSARDLLSSLSNLKSSREPNSAQRESNKRPTRSIDGRVPSLEDIEARKATLKSPMRLANLEEGANNARKVHTLSQVEAPTFFSKSNKVTSAAEPPLTPIHRLPTTPTLPNAEFRKADNYLASVRGKAIFDTNGQPISKTTWGLYKPAQKEELIRRALEPAGSGKRRRSGRGRKNYEDIQEHPLLYDTDRNDLWAKR